MTTSSIIAALDLTNHRASVMTGGSLPDGQPEVIRHSKYMPATLLPLLPREPLLSGPASDNHRRGAGLAWPREAQAPIEENPGKGVGRIPMPLVWGRLLRPRTDLPEEPQNGLPPELCRYTQDSFMWDYQSGAQHAFSPAQIIAAGMRGWLPDKYEKVGLVVPDSLGEEAQQAILDECGRFGREVSVVLIPRTIALALDWCRRNESQYQGAVDDASVGHIWVASMSMDLWEVDLVEIKAKRPKDGGKIRLVPVRHRKHRSDIPVVGLGLAATQILDQADQPSECWKKLFSSDSMQEIFDRPADMVARRIIDLQGSASRPAFDKFAGWTVFDNGLMDLVADGDPLLTTVETRLGDIHNQQQIIGAVSGGAFSSSLSWSCGLWDALRHTLPNARDTQVICNGDPAKGAWHAAHAIHNGQPSYLDTLVPIEIYVLRNGTDEAWISVVPDEVCVAGDSYKMDKPLPGFSVAAGSDHLDFTIRRPVRGMPDGYIYKGLPAIFGEPVLVDVPVLVESRAVAGQGFARIDVFDEGRNILDSHLDWSRMVTVPRPVPPVVRLAYIPEVSRVDVAQSVWARIDDPDRPNTWAHQNVDNYGKLYVPLLWENVAAKIRDVARGNDRVNNALWELIGYARGREVGNMNRWPFAHIEAAERGVNIEPNWFRHVSVFPSSGEIEEMVPEAGQFRATITNEYAANPTYPMARLAGWLYCAVPDEVNNDARQCFVAFNEPAPNGIPDDIMRIVYLHIAGLCWTDTDDIQMFMRAFSRAIQSGRIDDQSVEGEDSPSRSSSMHTEWLRAFRNIVRFRDNSLGQYVPDADIETITTHIAQTLSRSLNQHGPDAGKLRNECLRSVPFMLKRRRTNPRYLGQDSEDRNLLENALQRIVDQYGDWRHYYAAATLRFLLAKATAEDARNILQYAG